jgi:tetratricopeptide (TPR) repeat protein
MRWIPAVLLCVVFALRAGICLSQALDNPVLGQAGALVRDGKAEEAWRLLAPLERQYAGQPDFDYLLGVAALESGRPNRATFILERVVTVNPGHVAARLEMARAYFALRDFERAEREFNFILNSVPEADVRLLSQGYLARMRQAAQPEHAGFSGYAELSVGRDSNVSAAAAQSSVFIPGLGAEFVPDPLFQRRPDGFFALGAGLEYAHAVRADLGVVAGADLRQRWHSDADAFDARAAELEAVLIHRLDERNGMQYSLRHNHYELDSARYRETQSLGAQWSRALSLRTRIAVSGQGHRIRYRAEDAMASSSDLLAASAGATHLLQHSTLTTAAGAVYFGHDHAVAGRVDGDRRILGLSLGLQRRLLPRLEGYLRFSLIGSDYDTQNPDFGLTRRDRQRDAAVGLSWELADRWLLRPQLARTSNHSNLPLNEYRRTETSITLRRIWD